LSGRGHWYLVPRCGLCGNIYIPPTKNCFAYGKHWFTTELREKKHDRNVLRTFRVRNFHKLIPKPSPLKIYLEENKRKQKRANKLPPEKP